MQETGGQQLMVNSVSANRIRSCRQDRIFVFICVVILAAFFLITFYPIIYVISASFSSGKAVGSGKVVLLPVELSLEGYRSVFRNPNILTSYGNTILYTFSGSMLNICMALIAAYPLARKELPGKNAIMFFFTFTMYFGGGLIPTYMLIRELGMIDKIWALIIPSAVPVYNMILARTFIQSSIPGELLDAAKIDGCNDAKFFLKIVLPLSKAIIAVLAIYSMVAHWNSYFNAMLYINTPSKMPLQIILKQILISNVVTSEMLMMDPELYEAKVELANVLKFSLIVVSTAPIMVIYPFLQKYFVQGIMIGSLKG